MDEKKPFFLLKTKSELFLAEERKQLVLADGIRDELNKPEYGQQSLVGAKVTKNSPGKVVEVRLLNTPEAFLEVAF